MTEKNAVDLIRDLQAEFIGLDAALETEVLPPEAQIELRSRRVNLERKSFEVMQRLMQIIQDQDDRLQRLATAVTANRPPVDRRDIIDAVLDDAAIDIAPPR